LVDVTQAEEAVFNPFEPGFRENPAPTYARLMSERPRHRTPFGSWVFTKHADCMKILQHPETSHDPRNSEMFQMLLSGASDVGDEWQRRRSFLFMDPPDHTRLRGLVSKAFTARTIEKLRPRVSSVMNELIDRVEDQGKLELIEDVAYPLPVTIISEMLGVPTEDHEIFKDWSKELARSLDPEPSIPQDALRRREQAANDFRSYFDGLIDQRRENPGEDLLSGLIVAEEKGDTLTKDELLSTCILLLIAGHETTVNLIANGVLALLRSPKQFEKLKENRALAKGAVEETLRYDPPVLFTARVAMTDIEAEEITVSKGEQVILLLGAANRDPDVFEDPQRFDIARSKTPHLAFGMGIHFCIGAPLARVEGQIAFDLLAERLPEMELETDEPEYKENIVLRGMRALPISF
jgi:cytochrome P450